MFPIVLLAAFANAADYKPAGTATLTVASELTLYAPPRSRAEGWFVEAKLGDKAVLVQLGTSAADPKGHRLCFTEGGADQLGLKPTGAKGKQTVKIAGLTLGSLRIDGAGAICDRPPTAPDVAGIVNMTAFPELAWVVDGAAGKARVGPTGGAAAPGFGAAATYEQVLRAKHRIGAEVLEFRPSTLVLLVTVSGMAMPAQWSVEGDTRVSTEAEGVSWFKVGKAENIAYPLPAVDGLISGETEVEWREVSALGVSAWVPVRRVGTGLGYPFTTPAEIGWSALRSFDMALDAGARTVAFRPGAGLLRASYVEIAEAVLRKAVDTPAAAGTDAEAARRLLAGALAPLADFLVATGQATDALDVARRLTEAAPERCSSWLGQGRALLAAGEATAARGPLRKAGELYQPWAARPLAERTSLAADESARSKRADFDGVWSQPHACHGAWSLLAEAHLASGDAAGVAELYPKYVDLDPTLPLVAGNALLVQGNLAGAEAAFRQAVHLSYSQEKRARAGMLLATRERSMELAGAQMDQRIDTEPDALGTLLVLGETLRRQSADLAIGRFDGIVKREPWSVPAWLALATEQAAAGRPNAAALASAGTLLASSLPYLAEDARTHAWSAEHLRLSGTLAEAAIAGERATTLDPSDALGWAVRARVAESAGDARRAAELRTRAGQVGAADPVYARYLSDR
ncbi:MAG: hypothetical protein EXR71_00485 [Myxococcales bacterium]|nr:hypothetical protein [Myxococcales bacterium]